VYSFVDLPRDVSLFLGVRYVDELPNQAVDAYVATDLNVSWRIRPDLEASVAVQNLTDDNHPEFHAGTGTLIERGAYLKLDWSF
jgi:iron complex outermembrane receptor protein